MKITQLLQEDKVTLSLEVFPPKKDTAVEQVSRSVREIAALQPDFMSVTYGAGGGTSAYTVQIAKDIKAEYNAQIKNYTKQKKMDAIRFGVESWMSKMTVMIMRG